MIINLALLLVKIPCNHQSGTKLLHVVLALSSQRDSPGSMQNAANLYWTQIAGRDISLISCRLPQPTQAAGLECIIRILV